jgi:hypothetical protein
MRLLCIAGILLLSGLAHASLDLEDGVFSDKTLGLKINLPEKWTPSVQTGFPDLLLLLVHSTKKATIWLATGVIPAKQTLKTLVEDSRTGLQAVGIQIVNLRNLRLNGRDVWDLEARARDPGLAIRQIYLQQQQQAYILTLRCPVKDLPNMWPELKFILAAMEFTTPATSQP